MQDILVQIGNYGFPMVVAVYLLVRVEKKLDALTAAISRLEQVLASFLRSPLQGEPPA
ncbi:MAG: YvrJ family protein [Thermacetogeniaceae bacterium]